MADEADQAQERMEREEVIYRYQSKRDEPDKQSTGECWNCGEPLKDRRWCDAHCRDEWQLREL